MIVIPFFMNEFIIQFVQPQSLNFWSPQFPPPCQKANPSSEMCEKLLQSLFCPSDCKYTDSVWLRYPVEAQHWRQSYSESKETTVQKD